MLARPLRMMTDAQNRRDVSYFIGLTAAVTGQHETQGSEPPYGIAFAKKSRLIDVAMRAISSWKMSRFGVFRAGLRSQASSNIVISRET